MVCVVSVLEVGDPDSGVKQGEPLIHVQALVSDAIVERLDEPVTPRFTWRDVPDPDLVLAELSQCFGDEFGAVVATDQHRQTTNRNNELECSNEVVAGDRPGRNVEQRFASVFIDHRLDLELSAISGRVELEIDRPHHVRSVGLNDRP